MKLTLWFVSMLFYCGFSVANLKVIDAHTNANPKVILFVKADKEYQFWQSSIQFASAVADALSIDFIPHYIPIEYRERFSSVEYIRRYLKKLKAQPHLVMSPFFLGAENEFLNMLRSRSIPFISLNSYVSQAQFQAFGKPREKYPLWLGHLSPNDIEVGKQLMKSLIEKYKYLHCDTVSACQANVFGFSGLPYAAVSQQRKLGVETILQQNPYVASYDAVAADWRREVAFNKMGPILYRHKELDIIWAASDSMAWGVVDGLQANSYSRKPLIGSIDWAPKTIPLIQSGDITLSLGGHFLEPGLALILYYDYLHGIDFQQSQGTVIETELSELNQINISQLGSFLLAPKWDKKIIQQYSKHNNPDRKSYEFDPLTIVHHHLH